MCFLAFTVKILPEYLYFSNIFRVEIPPVVGKMASSSNVNGNLVDELEEAFQVSAIKESILPRLHLVFRVLFSDR